MVVAVKMAYPDLPPVLLKGIFRALASSRTSDFCFDENTFLGNEVFEIFCSVAISYNSLTKWPPTRDNVFFRRTYLDCF